MDYRSQMITVVDAYCRAMRRAESTVATQAAGHGAFFARIRDGSSLTIDRFSRVMSWFRANWPDGLPWPEGCGVIHALEGAAPVSARRQGAGSAGGDVCAAQQDQDGHDASMSLAGGGMP